MIKLAKYIKHNDLQGFRATVKPNKNLILLEVY